MLAKLPFSNNLLEHTQVADVTKNGTSSFDSIAFFNETSPALIDNSSKQDAVETEFLKCQSFPLPQDILDCKEIDTAWYKMSKRKEVYEKFLFANLANLMLSISTIFHSNVDCERFFLL